MAEVMTRHAVRVSGLTFETLSGSQLAEWLLRSRAGYVDERMAAGDTLAEATANADASLNRTFPGGLRPPVSLLEAC